ncbi:hypothetical protein SAMN04488557_2991 [Hyphomicrobium facile]|uniref:Uncharacterized protein n=1 Tax=Hyphomicrobium facile TaxID=51670 RepID=A0A1I7NR94_9HYPH|nr:hypothetical protein SAMN04488557_2991 [Hyphomicrobium facile]
MKETGLPGSVLVELYIRLRDQMESGESNLDANHKDRVCIAMAIFAAEDRLGANITEVEAHVREVLGLVGPVQIAA